MTEDLTAFYLPIDEDVFESTEATQSPWDFSLQHGGPPAGLLARAIDRARPAEDMRIARVTIDMLGGIPQGRMRTEATVVRPGRRVEMIEAKLWADDRLAVTATAWRIRLSPDSTIEVNHEEAPATLPGEQPQHVFSGVDPSWGYGRAMEWRFVSGDYDSLGPALAWGRLRVPLVAGETTSATAQLLTMADSANGLSVELPMAEWFSIPSTLTATIQRAPAGEWMLMDARTSIGADGIGLTRAQVYDERGFSAEIAQPLLVARR
ncbi:thioesterase family protein [Aeromicrobium sp. Leaf350]|uniref:thioesterase family protein n=1 Tax=Aeromicrobium sp. Leaf350 TaxID=2876565 RepID=UPI001E293665|nr:thioesterase family protein [Aeromicrobium sp. Leaf350]